MIWMLTALAQEPTLVPAGDTQSVNGPAVVLPEWAYRRYVTDSRQLPHCLEALDDAVDDAIAANARVLRAHELARAEFEDSSQLEIEQLRTIEQLGKRGDALARQRNRLRGERNVALGVAVVLAAGLVLSL